jgi:aryl-alcohol dehydrogenase-like predicted oxidoreductase
MKRRILGATGISVSEYALGCMNFGRFANSDHDDAVSIIHAALDAGINFVDTADVYSGGESEVIVGKALKGRRDDVVLATKFGLPMSQEANHSGGSARRIRRAVEDSLRRLDTDYIDLYQMHRADHTTDLDETLSALSDLIRSGKVHAIGHSTFPVEHLVEAQWSAQKGGHRRFVTEQPRYSIFNRTVEAAVLPAAQRYGMGVLTYGPLASGWLSGRTHPAKSIRAGRAARDFDPDVPGNQAKMAALRRLTDVAKEAGMPLAHLALAFVRSHPAVTSVLLGPRTLEQLTNLLVGADIELDDAILDRIDEIVLPGTELNPADNYFADPLALTDKRLRRR